MLSLSGKRIFISGAAAGMGHSVARLALDAGAMVVATDIASHGLDVLSQAGATTAILDVTDADMVAQFFASEDGFDGIVNMAGWVHHGTILDVDYADWQKSFSINLNSMFFVIQSALPKMIERGGG